MLSGENDVLVLVLDLFRKTRVSIAKEKSAVDIDKKQRKIQEVQSAYDRTENTVRRTVQQATLVNARKTLAKLVIYEQTQTTSGPSS